MNANKLAAALLIVGAWGHQAHAQSCPAGDTLPDYEEVRDEHVGQIDEVGESTRNVVRSGYERIRGAVLDMIEVRTGVPAPVLSNVGNIMNSGTPEGAAGLHADVALQLLPPSLRDSFADMTTDMIHAMEGNSASSPAAVQDRFNRNQATSTLEGNGCDDELPDYDEYADDDYNFPPVGVEVCDAIDVNPFMTVGAPHRQNQTHSQQGSTTACGFSFQRDSEDPDRWLEWQIHVMAGVTRHDTVAQAKSEFNIIRMSVGNLNASRLFAPFASDSLVVEMDNALLSFFRVNNLVVQIQNSMWTIDGYPTYPYRVSDSAHTWNARRMVRSRFDDGDDND